MHKPVRMTCTSPYGQIRIHTKERRKMHTRKRFSSPAVVLAVLVVLMLAVGLTRAQGLDPEAEALSPDGSVESLGPPDLPATDGSESDDAALADTVSLRVAGSAMRPRDSDVEWSHGTPNEGCTYASSGNAVRTWTTPVYLPQGSTVRALRMYYYDTSTDNSQGWLAVYDYYGAVVEQWELQSSGTPGFALQNRVITHTIDYDMYSYVLNWRPNDTGSDMQLCGFRIFYDSPPFGAAFLPAVLRE
jgi:hypothetical protein